MHSEVFKTPNITYLGVDDLTVIPWLGPEFSCRKRFKTFSPVYPGNIAVLDINLLTVCDGNFFLIFFSSENGK